MHPQPPPVDRQPPPSYPQPPKAPRLGFYLALGLFVALAFACLPTLLLREPDRSQGASKMKSESETSLPQTPVPPPAAPAPPAPSGPWRYSASYDRLGRGVVRTATTESLNTVNFSFPYDGPQRARLVMRINADDSGDALIILEQGQILLDSFSEGPVYVRFDNRPVMRYLVNYPADHSRDMVFIQDAYNFGSYIQSGKLARIQLTVYKEGSPTFEFDISGFDLRRLSSMRPE